MQANIDRRREKRIPIELHLEINHMFRQNNEVIDRMDATIEVTNISKSGIGFASKAVLPVDYYFNARIQLGKNDFFCAVVKILRQTKSSENTYLYGAEFVGLAPFLADKIMLYEEKLQKNETTYV